MTTTTNLVTLPMIVDTLAADHGLTKAKTKELLTSFVELITTNVVGGNQVRLSNLGTFSAAPTAARTARNPITGGAIEVAASHRVSFKAAAGFKSQVKAI